MAAAKIIAEQHAGQNPVRLRRADDLPGVGQYMAGAI